MRLEMLQVARLAPKFLGESSRLVADFLRRQQNSDGGFMDRAGRSDLYYTVFGIDGLIALQADLPIVRIEEFLRSFGDGPDLDPRAVDRVIDVWRGSNAPRLAATYGGVRLHPVLLARAAWNDVPDEGLRGLPAEPVPCDDLSPPGDVDFADDMSRRQPPRGEE